MNHNQSTQMEGWNQKPPHKIRQNLSQTQDSQEFNDSDIAKENMLVQKNGINKYF